MEQGQAQLRPRPLLLLLQGTGGSRAAEIPGEAYSSSALLRPACFLGKKGFRKAQVLYALFLPFKLCMTCMVNKAENISVQNMMVILSPNFKLQENKCLNEKADVGTECF